MAAPSRCTRTANGSRPRRSQGKWKADAAARQAWEPAMELGAVAMEPWGDVDHPVGPSKALYPSADAIAGLMKQMGVPPDFDYVTQSAERNLRYIHKRIGKTDLFFVANEKPHPERPCAVSASRANAPSCGGRTAAGSSARRFMTRRTVACGCRSGSMPAGRCL